MNYFQRFYLFSLNAMNMSFRNHHVLPYKTMTHFLHYPTHCLKNHKFPGINRKTSPYGYTAMLQSELPMAQTVIKRKLYTDNRHANKINIPCCPPTDWHYKDTLLWLCSFLQSSDIKTSMQSVLYIINLFYQNNITVR